MGTQLFENELRNNVKVDKKIKTMLTVFFYYGVLHSEFLLRNQTINKECLSVIRHLLEAIRKKQSNCRKRIHGFNTTLIHIDADKQFFG